MHVFFIKNSYELIVLKMMIYNFRILIHFYIWEIYSPNLNTETLTTKIGHKKEIHSKLNTRKKLKYLNYVEWYSVKYDRFFKNVNSIQKYEKRLGKLEKLRNKIMYKQ